MLQNNVPNDDIEARERKQILQKLSELHEEFMEMRSNMNTLTANINTSLSEGRPDKFAGVVSFQMLTRCVVAFIFNTNPPQFPLPNRSTA